MVPIQTYDNDRVDGDHDSQDFNNDLLLLGTLSAIDALRTVQLKILSTLYTYPKISPSMLNTGIGPAIPPAIWRPALQHLVEQGLVTEGQTNRHGITGRSNTQRHVELSPAGLSYAEKLFAPPEVSVSAVPSSQGRE